MKNRRGKRCPGFLDNKGIQNFVNTITAVFLRVKFAGRFSLLCQRCNSIFVHFRSAGSWVLLNNFESKFLVNRQGLFIMCINASTDNFDVVIF